MSMALKYQPPAEPTVNTSPEALIDKRHLAKLLDCTPRTVEAYVKARSIPHFKINRAVKFRFSDVIAALERGFHVDAN